MIEVEIIGEGSYSDLSKEVNEEIKRLIEYFNVKIIDIKYSSFCTPHFEYRYSAMIIYETNF